MSGSSDIELLPIHNRKSNGSPLSKGNFANAIDGQSDTISNSPPLQLENDRLNPSRPLSIQDRPQFFLLILLYLLQGIPVGLAFGSVPFLLKSKLSYSQVGIFSLASYPYSLKLLWSPVVDAIYNKRIGRRKSWIIPIQLISGSTLIFLGKSIDQLLENPADKLNEITWTFFTLVFLCATQDIAVDGWALTILSQNSLSYASTAQTIGLNTGYFLSFTVFLALNSTEFSNKYLRSIPQEYGVVSLNGYLTFWGVVYILVTIFVAGFVEEVPGHLARARKSSVANIENENRNTWNSLQNVYTSMMKVLKLSNVQTFILIHLTAKIGFQANEGATNLKLLEKGFAREDLAITVLIDFPFEIIFGYYVARWSTGKSSLTPWLYAFLGRLLSAALAQLVVYSFPKSGHVNTGYFLFVILQHLLGSFMSTIQFVSINAFHTQISDPLIGGTYMTTLNTISNLGGQWPKLIVLNMIDWLTDATCENDASSATPFVSDNFICKNDEMKKLCVEKGGYCHVKTDGYYLTNAICISIALVLFFTWIRPKVLYLQKLPTSQWRVKE